MIAHLEGRLARVGDRSVVLDVSGIGYRVFVTADAARLLGKKTEKAFLFIYHAIREDGEDLYGFLEEAELELFEMLLSVSGIGPKSALQIMGLAGVETLKKAISSEDTSYLTKVSGIGRKTAEKIVLELKDKLGGGGGVRHGELREESDAVEALKSLGYSQAEARDALKQVGAKAAGTGNRVKEALKLLGNGGK